MIGRVVLLAVLLLAISWLLFGAGWEDENLDQDEQDSPLEAGDAPQLSGSKRKALGPEDAEEERRAAAAMLAELLNGDETAQLRVLQAHRGVAPFNEALVKHLIALLQAKNPLLQWQARVKLQNMGVRIAPLIAPLFTSDVTELRLHALGLLGTWLQSGGKPELPDLLILLEDPDRAVRQTTLALICAYGVPYEDALAKKLLALLDTDPSGSSNGPAAGLARMGREGVALLLTRLDSPNLRTRVSVLSGLTSASPDLLKANIGALKHGLGDPEEQVKSAALWALIVLKGDCVECLGALQALLQDEALSLETVQGTVHVLELMGSRAAEAVPLLVERLDEHEEFIADSIAKALAAIAAYPDLVIPALTSLIEKEFSDAGAKALAAYGARGYRAARLAFEQGDEDVRYALLWTFATYGERAADAVPLLLPLITGDDYDARERAVGTVGFIGPRARAALPAIMDRLAEGPDVLTPQAASATLARMGPVGEEALRQALRSKKAKLRLQAAKVVQAFHGRSQFAYDELEALLDDKDVKVRRAALLAATVTVFHWSGGGIPEEAGLDPKVRARLRAMLEHVSRDADATLRRDAEAWRKQLDEMERQRTAR